MANNIFKLSGILKVAVLTADPAGGAPGSIYYNSTSGKFRMYDGSGWNNTAIGNLSLTGQPLSTSRIITGDNSNISQAVDTSSVGDALVTFDNGIVVKTGAIGTAKLADAAVTTVKILDANVTLAKLAANAVDNTKLADNAVSTTKIQDAAVTNSKIAAAAVTSASLASDSVITVKILDQNVTTAKIADANVTTAKIAASAVTNGQLADNAVTTSKIVDQSVTSGKIADGNVGTTELADASVTTAKIASGAVTNAKLVGVASTVKGALSDGVLTDLTTAQHTTLVDAFHGDAGSGGLKGAVPAPAAGDAAAHKYLQADGTWAIPTGAGDLSGPAGATDNAITRFDGVTGKLTQNSLATIDDSGNIAATGANLSSLTASTALATDASKNIVSSTTTAAELGFVHGVTSAIQTQIDSKISTATAASTYIPLTQKAVSNGVATLDAGGKIPAAQLPNTVMEYQGAWNASTNTPTLADGTGNAGDTYRVSVAGSQNLGSGTQGFFVGDLVLYSGSVWQRAPAADGVISVNGQQGAVVLTTDNVAEGTTNKYYLDSRAQAAAVVDSLAGTQTNVAPSVHATNAALATKIGSVQQDTAPTLGGPLSLNGQQVNGVLKQGNGTAGQFMEEQYIQNITITASSSSAAVTALAFDKTIYRGIEITYTLFNADTTQARMGRLRVIVAGTGIGLSDDLAETADVGLSWDTSISTNTVNINATTGPDDITMKCQVRRFLL